MCTAPQVQSPSGIVGDNAGGIFLTWGDVRSGTPGIDLFARSTPIGDCGLERDGREDLTVIELFDPLVECDAVFSEEDAPRDDRVFVEVDVLDHEHELLVADD